MPLTKHQTENGIHKARGARLPRHPRQAHGIVDDGRGPRDRDGGVWNGLRRRWQITWVDSGERTCGEMLDEMIERVAT